MDLLALEFNDNTLILSLFIRRYSNTYQQTVEQKSTRSPPFYSQCEQYTALSVLSFNDLFYTQT